MRVFLGIFPPQSIIDHLLTVVKSQPVIEGVRWIPPESLHITLKFIGDIDPSQQESLSAAMGQIVPNFPPVNLRLESGGVFPSASNPRVFWVGLTGDEKMVSNLSGALEKHLEELGFPPENRRYSPHVTLGRSLNSHLSGAAAQFETLFKSYRSPEFVVNEVCFVRSILSSRGVRYETLSRVAMRLQ